MIFNNFTIKSQKSVQNAIEIATAKQNQAIETSHLLKGMYMVDKDVIPYLLKKLNVNLNNFIPALDRILDSYPKISGEEHYLSNDATKALQKAIVFSQEFKDEFVSIECLLQGILSVNDSTSSLLNENGVTEKNMRTAISQLREGATMNSQTAKKSYNSLNKFARNLNDFARRGKSDPIFCRDEEIRRVLQIISRRTKNNPILIGEPGVGKTAIAEGLAHRIINGDVPDNLKTKQIYSLDIGALIAGAKFRGEFEERLKSLVKEVISAEGEIILFIEDIHMLVGAGAIEGTMNAAFILEPALSRGKLHVIGATTLKEYQKYFEKDKVLERRFEPVIVNEPDTLDAISILRGIKEKYETHHHVMIKDEAIIAAVELSQRYISNRNLPDKAIDMIDEAASKLRLEINLKPEDLDKIERVGAEEIAQVVSHWTGIPVSMMLQTEDQKLLNLEVELHKRVVGQDEAIEAVSDTLRRSRAGFQDAKRPLGSFLFLGTTGVGKTELAKALAEFLFNNESSMVRTNMSECQEQHTVSRLIGAPQGYIGYKEGGQLTEAVRRKPYSVVLLDEIEKANPDVFNILLQVLDDGLLTDNQGSTVDFKNTIIIMTSNVGPYIIQESLENVTERNRDEVFDRTRQQAVELLKKTIPLKFLKRIDEIIIFKSLTKDEIQMVVELHLGVIQKKLEKNNIRLKVTRKAIQSIATESFDLQFGAWPIKRVIQQNLLNELSKTILEGKVNQDIEIVVDEKDGNLMFRNT
jgi:ATP-dependent Clp protease ATP-binding subunit ClpA